MINYIIISINRTNNLCFTHIYIPIIFYTKKSKLEKLCFEVSKRIFVHIFFININYNESAYFNNKLENVSNILSLKFHFPS